MRIQAGANAIEGEELQNGIEEEPRCDVHARLRRGSNAYRRVNLALLAAGFSTFAILYCVQPLMPVFAAGFGISPSAASLSLSCTTATLALAMLIAGQISDTRGRKGMMAICLFSVGLLTVLSAFATNWGLLLAIRTLEGIALSGVPAVGMAYLAEEVHPADLGGAMGLYVAGNAFGGMAGRVLTSLLIEWSGSWRIALATIGCLGIAAAAVFAVLLPKSRHFVAGPRPSWTSLASGFALHFRDRGLRRLFLMGFLLMGGFVTVYNYASFRLLGPPFNLGQGAAGAIFLVYLFGGPASPTFGRLAGRLGRGRMLASAVLLMFAGLLLTLSPVLALTITGIALITIGFFGGHAVASGWVSRRAIIARAQAASIYLFCYYAGSSLIGSLGGEFYSAAGWWGIVGLVGGLLGLAFLVALRLGRLEIIEAGEG